MKIQFQQLTYYSNLFKKYFLYELQKDEKS